MRPNKYAAKKTTCAAGHLHDERMVERFMEKTVRDASGCLLWTAAKAKFGHGLFTVALPNHHRVAKAHRIAWEIANRASLLPGSVIRHTCDNPACVEPAHLIAGTQAENVKDSWERGRSWRHRGESSQKAQLTEAQVLDARLRFKTGEPIPKIAAEYGVKYPALYNAVQGRSWAWLP